MEQFNPTQVTTQGIDFHCERISVDFDPLTGSDRALNRHSRFDPFVSRLRISTPRWTRNRGSSLRHLVGSAGQRLGRPLTHVPIHKQEHRNSEDDAGKQPETIHVHVIAREVERAGRLNARMTRSGSGNWVHAPRMPGMAFADPHDTERRPLR
jgi:hypothetical protein